MLVSRLSLLVLLVGCAEGIVVESYPNGATLYVADRFVGQTPVTYWVPRSGFSGRPIPFRVEKAGFEPVSGEFEICVGGGRAAGAVLTLGVSTLFKRPTTFCQDKQTVYLRPEPFARSPTGP